MPTASSGSPSCSGAPKASRCRSRAGSPTATSARRFGGDDGRDPAARQGHRRCSGSTAGRARRQRGRRRRRRRPRGPGAARRPALPGHPLHRRRAASSAADLREPATLRPRSPPRCARSTAPARPADRLLALPDRRGATPTGRPRAARGAARRLRVGPRSSRRGSRRRCRAPSTSRSPATTTCSPRTSSRRRRRHPDRRLGVRGDGRPLLRPRQLRGQQRARRATQEAALLEAYFGEPATPARLAALRLMRFMSDFREAMWGVVQGTLSDLDFDFATTPTSTSSGCGRPRPARTSTTWLEEARWRPGLSCRHRRAA